jgi:dihydroflavonol-4-reductase
MRHIVKNVFIAGGTGFIGYHAAKLFLERDILVSTIALPGEIDLEGWYPKAVDIAFGNLFTMSKDEIVTLLKKRPYDTFLYALGPDDRFVPPAPAYEFFHEKLVVQTYKICQAAKEAGIRRCIVLNSYFSHFDKLYKHSLSKHHPYIRARIEQENAVFELDNTGFFDVMVLELPFIFGVMPKRKPLWREYFLSFFDGRKQLFFPRSGGTAVISVEGVAEAIVACAHNGESKTCYPVGKMNMSYRHLIETMMGIIGDHRKYVSVSPWLAGIFARKIDSNYHKDGKESGLNHLRLMTDVLCKSFYVDPDFMMDRLGFDEFGFTGGKSIETSLDETMRACYPEKFK